MLKKNILKEIIPLTQADCFTVFTRTKSGFDFPLHYHEEFELNLVINAAGARRVVGDHIDEISDLELVLVGSNLEHGWFTHKCKSKDITEVTIQFHKDLFEERFLRRNQLSFFRGMLEKSSRGILFSRETAERVSGRILQMGQNHGFDSILELMSILHDLSVSNDMSTLSDASFSTASGEISHYNGRRIEMIMEHVNKNFEKEITLKEAAALINMTEVSFSRFFKQRTGNTFIDSLTEIRIGNATRLLIDTSKSVAEIAYDCGFNNISNFNRIFKKRKGCVPKDFRKTYQAYGTRMFI
ncbi:MAG: AraC family transcriptional regulator [Chitinophagaceae bacterium]|nr:MAG: AraC family transcriptional regulator [Chitinophagaceae bacterium]